MMVVYLLVNISYMAVLGIEGILESEAVALVSNYVVFFLLGRTLCYETTFWYNNGPREGS